MKLDTNSPTKEDRHLFVHKSLYLVGILEGCGYTGGKTPQLVHLTPSELEKPSGTKTMTVIFLRATESKFSYLTLSLSMHIISRIYYTS